MNKEEIADKLEEYADFLSLDGQDGRSHAYDNAARTIRLASYLPADPSRLDGIGDSTREIVIDLDNGKQIDELEDLREKYSWYDELREVKYIGPSRARTFKNMLGVETLDKLEMVANNGDLTLVDGIGPATANKIKQSIEEVK